MLLTNSSNALRQDLQLPRTEIELSGFSGAKVLLIREGNAPAFIRKISGSPGGNARLQAQAIKQRLTASQLIGCATTPKILEEGHLDGLYYFDMQYIKGLDGITYLRTASFPAIARFLDKLLMAIERFADLQDPQQLFSPRQNSLGKCHDILSAISTDDLRARNAMLALIDILENATMPDELAVTACHGDLTLENIVVTEAGDVVFIDFLDTFLSHWIADVGKLEQDLRAGWYMRKADPLPLGVISYFRQALATLSNRLLKDAPELLPIVLCVHLARILPYTRTIEDRSFVLDRLEQLIAKHISNEY